MKTILHLTSSRFLGGPERQMLGLAQALTSWHTAFASFSEQGLCRDFLNAGKRLGCFAHELANDTPHLLAAIREVKQLVQRVRADVLVCHGYKANLLGRIAAAQTGVKAMAVSRGWTGESWKIRLYESIDRRTLRTFKQVVCVSHAQATKVARQGIAPQRISVIHNAVELGRFTAPESRRRQRLLAMFKSPPRLIVGAAGRLSPEKGFDVLIRAAGRVVADDKSVGFLIFGEGASRRLLEQQIAAARLHDSVKLMGFSTELDQDFPQLDMFVLPSFTEGLPNVILEAFAARVPVVATHVGGTPEVVEDQIDGYLVPAGDDAALAARVMELASSASQRAALAARGRQRIERDFSFAAQAEKYERLLQCPPDTTASSGHELGHTESTREVAISGR